MPDPFGTAGLRAAVLDSWAGSPTRFREDANAEEDLRLGGYADAWFVELAQNAVDAARVAGVPGRVRVRVEDGELRVANTGAALDAAGVAALASLRASAKRDDTGSVGRFGVGFAAVLAVTDAPRMVGEKGGVAFSAARTAAAVAVLPGPAAELARRDGPPVLRLVWPTTEEPPPDGFDTDVRLPLRPGVAADALLAQARSAAADLLLALPGLVEITVAGAVLRRVDGPGPGDVTVGDRRWRLARRSGTLDEAESRAQATEQRGRREWSAGWALPLTTAGDPDPLTAVDVLHAPTATAEPIALPARLIATVPLEPDRRRLRPGPATDRVLAAAAAAYLDLVLAVPPTQRLPLVPEPGFPRSELDGRLHDLLLDALRATAWLPGVTGADLVPGRAEWLDLPGGRLRRLLAEAGFDRLLVVDTPPSAELGVPRLSAAELVDRLFGVERPPAWWHALYTELGPLAETVPGLVDELRALPVPLADGRTAAGPATVLLPPDPPDGAGARAVEPVAALALPGLHVVHPAAAHPLLARLGAATADPAGLLEHPALVAAAQRSVDDADAGLDQVPLAEAVLALVTEVGRAPASLGALALPDADGRPARADELMLPDAAVRPLLAPDGPLGVLDATWAQRAPRSVLTTLGVADGFAVVVDEEPVGPDHDLDDEEQWWDGLDAPPARLVAVRDLDLVDESAWPAALALLASGPETRAALTAPGSYSAWWLARHARIGGRRPRHWRVGSARELAALYDPVPVENEVVATDGPQNRHNVVLDEPVLAAIGVRTDLTVADAAAAADLLARLADPARRPDAALVAAAHTALAAAVTSGVVQPSDLDPPARVRTVDGSVADVDVATVLDEPWLAAVLPPAELVTGGDAAALAELLDLPLASEVVEAEIVDGARVDGNGRAVRWADLPEVVVACHTLSRPVPPGEVTVHRELHVQVRRPLTGRYPVPAWRDRSGRWHAADPLRALLGLLATEQWAD